MSFNRNQRTVVFAAVIMNWAKHVLVHIVLHVIFPQRQTDRGPGIWPANGNLPRPSPSPNLRMSLQNGHVLVIREGNNLSPLYVSHFQSHLLSSDALRLEQSGGYISEKTRSVFLCFSIPSRSGSGSVSFFHHRLVKRVTPLLIGWVSPPISTAIGRPGVETLSDSSPSLTHTISWLCSRVGWFGMTFLRAGMLKTWVSYQVWLQVS